jgi:hypothetical protein
MAVSHWLVLLLLLQELIMNYLVSLNKNEIEVMLYVALIAPICNVVVTPIIIFFLKRNEFLPTINDPVPFN